MGRILLVSFVSSVSCLATYYSQSGRSSRTQKGLKKMANRRMFSRKITSSSEFLMMSQSAQNLYFHLGMNADDDGICEIFTVMRMTDSKPDDLRSLHEKGFVYIFDSRVLVIRDWHENNLIRKDRYEMSIYLKNDSNVKEMYGTVMCKNPLIPSHIDSGLPLGNQRLPQDRLGKDRIGKDTDTSKPNNSISYLDSIPDKDINELKEISSASKEQIISKAQDLKDYCASHGKRYKDYKAFLRNALKKDYPKLTKSNSITI